MEPFEMLTKKKLSKYEENIEKAFKSILIHIGGKVIYVSDKGMELFGYGYGDGDDKNDHNLDFKNAMKEFTATRKESEVLLLVDENDWKKVKEKIESDDLEQYEITLQRKKKPSFKLTEQNKFQILNDAKNEYEKFGASLTILEGTCKKAYLKNNEPNVCKNCKGKDEQLCEKVRIVGIRKLDSITFDNRFVPKQYLKKLE
ncbi:MAG: hypothetical protein HQK79_22010, partial [Desulfobacterales bacterium]|nr:hypothetical protein [Desulfobacterales bacterium]